MYRRLAARVVAGWHALRARRGLPLLLVGLLVSMLPGMVFLRAPDEAQEFDSVRFTSGTAEGEGTAMEDSHWEFVESDSDPFGSDLSAGRGESEGEGLDPSSLDCLMNAWEEIELRSPVIGKIQALHAERAQVVTKGELIVELDSRVEAARIATARKKANMSSVIESKETAQLLSERREERADKLFESSALSRDVRDEVKTEAALAKLELNEAIDQRDLARLELDEAIAALELRRIRSPIDGVVTSRHLSTGEVVDDEVIMNLAQLDPLRVEVILPASRFGSVEVGMKAAVVAELPENEARVGTVTIVDPVVDAASGSFGVQISLPNPGARIPSGLRCEVRFLSEDTAAVDAQTDAG